MGNPSLIGFLGMPIVSKATRRRLFGGPFIRQWDLFVVSSCVYETGAILGRAKRDKLEVLGSMIEGADKGFQVIKDLQQLAQQRLAELEEPPKTFFDLIIKPRLRELGLCLTDVPQPSERSALIKTFDERIPPKEAEPFIKLHGLEGIGFGSYFPKLTEKLYRNSYENINMDEWSQWREEGLAIPEKHAIITLEEREQDVLTMVAVYATAYYPELVVPLELPTI